MVMVAGLVRRCGIRQPRRERPEPESDVTLAKRFRQRIAKLATAAEKRSARITISKAFQKIGAETRGRTERVGQRVRGQMAKVIEQEFLSETGEPVTRQEARDLSKRFSLAGVARKQATRARTYYVDQKGRFRDARKATRGRFITKSNATRRDKLSAYWSTIRMISKAQGVSMSEARRAYTLTGAEPWREVAPGKTP